MTFTDEQIEDMARIALSKDPSANAVLEALFESGRGYDAICAVAEHAASLEQETCCKDICGYCEDGVSVERDQWGKWWHPQGAPVPARGEDYEMMCSVLCNAQKIRARRRKRNERMENNSTAK